MPDPAVLEERIYEHHERIANLERWQTDQNGTLKRLAELIEDHCSQPQPTPAPVPCPEPLTFDQVWNKFWGRTILIVGGISTVATLTTTILTVFRGH